MARTSAEDVRAELERADFPTAGLENDQIETVAIEPANTLVDEYLGDTGQSDAILTLIERYWAGHLILSSGIDDLRQTSSERTDREQRSYTGEFGEGLKSTTLGQKAITADTSGTLAQLSKPAATVDVPDSKGVF